MEVHPLLPFQSSITTQTLKRKRNKFKFPSSPVPFLFLSFPCDLFLPKQDFCSIWRAAQISTQFALCWMSTKKMPLFFPVLSPCVAKEYLQPLYNSMPTWCAMGTAEMLPFPYHHMMLNSLPHPWQQRTTDNFSCLIQALSIKWQQINGSSNSTPKVKWLRNNFCFIARLWHIKYRPVLKNTPRRRQKSNSQIMEQGRESSERRDHNLLSVLVFAMSAPSVPAGIAQDHSYCDW